MSTHFAVYCLGCEVEGPDILMDHEWCPMVLIHEMTPRPIDPTPWDVT